MNVKQLKEDTDADRLTPGVGMEVYILWGCFMLLLLRLDPSGSGKVCDS